MALRNCSKDVKGGGQCIYNSGEGVYVINEQTSKQVLMKEQSSPPGSIRIKSLVIAVPDLQYILKGVQGKDEE